MDRQAWILQERATTIILITMIGTLLGGFLIIILGQIGAGEPDLRYHYSSMGGAIMVGAMWFLPILGWAENAPQEVWERVLHRIHPATPTPIPEEGPGTCALCGTSWIYSEDQEAYCPGPNCGWNGKEPVGFPVWARPEGTTYRALQPIPMSEAHMWTGSRETLMGFESVSRAWVPVHREEG